MSKSIRKTIEVEIEIPMVPNFLRYGDRKLLPLSAFSEEELRDVAAAWTKELLSKAKSKKKHEQL